MKVALLTPIYNKSLRIGESLGLRYLASFIGSDIVDIYEPILANMELVDVISSVVKAGYGVVGISIQFEVGLSSALEIIRGIKSHYKPFIVVGGHFATFSARELLASFDEIDIVVMQEGEIIFKKLVDAISCGKPYQNIEGIAYKYNGIVKVNVSQPLIDNIDVIPFPLRDNNTAQKYHYTVASSRGCVYSCTFCSVPAFHNNVWRFRSPANVADEIELLVVEHGAKVISFVDDNFVGSTGVGRNRALNIAREILQRKLNIKWSIECRSTDVDIDLFDKLVAAGLRHVFIGAETANESDVIKYNKKALPADTINAISILDKLCVSTKIHFIMFNNESNLSKLVQNIQFLKGIKKACFTTIVSKMIPYKGTIEFNRMNLAGELISIADSDYKFSNPLIALIYETAYNVLLPFKKVEIALDSLTFMYVTDNNSNYCDKLNKLKQLYVDLSDDMADAFLYIIKATTKSYKDNTVSQYIEHMKNKYAMLSDDYLSSIAKIAL